MRMVGPVRWPLTALTAMLLAASAILLAGLVAERRARESLAATVTADARLRQALLSSEIARFRLLPLALTDDRDVISALARAPGARDLLDRKLQRLAGQTGAATIYVIDESGRAIAASNWQTATSFVGRDYRFRRYYTDAHATGAGEQFALGMVSRVPGLYLTRRTATGQGVVVVKLEFDRIERQWRSAGGITYVTNAQGIILVTSRRDWRFATTRPIAPAVAKRVGTDIGIAALLPTPFRPLDETRIAMPARGGTFLLAQTPPDAMGWRVVLGMPEQEAIGDPVLSARIAALLASLALVALLVAVRERSRRRAEQTAALELAVAERTADLTREMRDRASAEAKAAELRDALRQANRLATLGQITASVAHETAQPVAAIRNYATSGEKLLDRGDTETVRENLKAIARLTERIGRVTDELRGFSRKGSGEIGPVPLADIVEGARLILKDQLSRVLMIWPDIPPGLHVTGGRIRLEQVLVILLQNAIEALIGRTDPRVEVALTLQPDAVRLSVTDNGPGVAADVVARIFTPFVTSRPTGLGLGLVIAQDIMADLGGVLRLVPSEAGACFEMELRRP